MKKLITVILLLCLCVGLISCSKASNTGPSGDQIVAYVENEPVYFWEFNFFLQDIKQAMLEQNGINVGNIAAAADFWQKEFDGKNAMQIAIEKAFDEAVSFKRQVIYAKQNGATISANFDEQLDEQIKMYKESAGEDYFSILLTEMGLENEEQYRQINRDNAYISNYYNVIASDGTVTVSEDEIKAFYDEYIAPTYDVVTAKHILISTVDENQAPLPDEDVKKAEKTAKDLHKKIKNGELDFDAAMQAYSQDPGLATSPDGYTFTRGEMVTAFEDTAFNLAVGEMSEPVLSEFGWHIILLTDAKTQTLAEATDMIVQQLTFSACTEYIKEQTAGYKVEKQEDVLSAVVF